MAARRPVWAFDIEAVDWDQERCAVAISEHGDVERFSGPGCLERLAEHMDTVRGTFVAHAAGIYDTLMVTRARSRPWQELVMSGSAVLCAKDGSLKVRDSFRWWLSGLRKVGEYLQKQDDARGAMGALRLAAPGAWLKKDVDRARIDELSDDETLAYCESDTEILMGGIRASRDYLSERGAPVAWTAGGSALALLQTLEPASWHALGKHQLDVETAIAAGACVRGARVERWALGEVGPVYVYDLKSAYPSAYAGRALPLGARHIDGDGGGRRIEGASWRVRWRWPWRDRIPPVLDQLTGCGAGWCEAWCVQDEIDLLDAAGVEHRRIEGWAPRTMKPIGQLFAHDLYAEKERGSFFGKVFLNSLHGKFSESPIKECWTLAKPDPSICYGTRGPEQVGGYWRFWSLSVDKRGMVPRHLQPLAAAQILGRTRATLARSIAAVVAAGGRVFYTDTDCIHTDLPPERMPFATGEKTMGAWGIEGGPYRGIYVAPKAYLLLDAEGRAVKGALKGMPLADLKDAARVDAASDARYTVPRYRGARGKERGADLRLEAFHGALAGPVQIEKESLASWATGCRRIEGVGHKALQVRTLQAFERAKRFQPDGPPDSWAYLAPVEKLGLLRTGEDGLIEDPEAAPVDDLFGWG